MVLQFTKLLKEFIYNPVGAEVCYLHILVPVEDVCLEEDSQCLHCHAVRAGFSIRHSSTCLGAPAI